MWYRFCQTVINQAVKLPDGSVVIPEKVAKLDANQAALMQLTGNKTYSQLNQPPLSLNPQTNSPAPPPSATRSMPPAMPAQTNPSTSNTQQKIPTPTTNQKTLPQRGGNETYISTAPNNYKLNGYDVSIENGKVTLTDKNGTEIKSQVSWMPGTSNMQILRDMKTNFDRYLIPKPKEDYQFT